MRARLATVLTLGLLGAAAAAAHPPGATGGEGGAPAPHYFERFLPQQSRLGVQLQDMTPELREFMRAPKEHGVLIVRVNEGSPAAKAGLRVGDVIVAAGGESVDGSFDVVHTVLRADKDAKLALEVVREGKRRTLEATLAGEPPLGADAMGFLEERGPEFRRNIEQRMRELETRLKQLEQQLRDRVSRDELDT